MQLQSQQKRSKIRKRCKVKTVSELFKDGSMFQKPKFLLSHILKIDFESETHPQELKPQDIETYGAFDEAQIIQILRRSITRDTLQKIIIDANKLCYLYHPIMQAIQTQLKPTKEQYKVRDIINLIFKGSFYQFLTFKTQPAKYLINNRNTEINVKTVVSGIFALISGRLTIQNISDTILFYRLEEALYETAPNGLPFQFNKIIKTMKKIDRNITAENFNQWQTRMKQIQPYVKYLQPYHFVYLISLSKPIKKKINVFQVDKNESKFQRQAQLFKSIKEDNTLIKIQKKKLEWKDETKARGLSFQQRAKIQKIQFMEKEFTDIRKKILSHKRAKSAYVTSKAITSLKQDFRKTNQKQNQYLLDTFQVKSRFKKQNERQLLKKHVKKLTIKKQTQAKKKQQQQNFRSFYENQLVKSMSQTPFITFITNPIKHSFFLNQIDGNRVSQEQKQFQFDFDQYQRKMANQVQQIQHSKIQKNTLMDSFKKEKLNFLKFKLNRHKNNH